MKRLPPGNTSYVRSSYDTAVQEYIYTEHVEVYCCTTVVDKTMKQDERGERRPVYMNNGASLAQPDKVYHFLRDPMAPGMCHLPLTTNTW